MEKLYEHSHLFIQPENTDSRSDVLPVSDQKANLGLLKSTVDPSEPL